MKLFIIIVLSLRCCTKKLLLLLLLIQNSYTQTLILNILSITHKSFTRNSKYHSNFSIKTAKLCFQKGSLEMLCFGFLFWRTNCFTLCYFCLTCCWVSICEKYQDGSRAFPALCIQHQSSFQHRSIDVCSWERRNYVSLPSSSKMSHYPSITSLSGSIYPLTHLRMGFFPGHFLQKSSCATNCTTVQPYIIHIYWKVIPPLSKILCANSLALSTFEAVAGTSSLFQWNMSWSKQMIPKKSSSVRSFKMWIKAARVCDRGAFKILFTLGSS